MEKQRKTPAKPTKPSIGDLVDRLYEHTQLALALDRAIRGQAMLEEWDSSALTALAMKHVEGLEKIHNSFIDTTTGPDRDSPNSRSQNQERHR